MCNVLSVRKVTASAASHVLSFLRKMQDTGNTQPKRHGAAAIQRCMGGTADEQITTGNACTRHPVKMQYSCCRKCFTGFQCTRHHCSLIAARLRAALQSFDYREAALNIL